MQSAGPMQLLASCLLCLCDKSGQSGHSAGRPSCMYLQVWWFMQVLVNIVCCQTGSLYSSRLYNPGVKMHAGGWELYRCTCTSEQPPVQGCTVVAVIMSCVSMLCSCPADMPWLLHEPCWWTSQPDMAAGCFKPCGLLTGPLSCGGWRWLPVTRMGGSTGMHSLRPAQGGVIQLCMVPMAKWTVQNV
jgi:hypothetical protein